MTPSIRWSLPMLRLIREFLAQGMSACDAVGAAIEQRVKEATVKREGAKP